MPHPLPPRPPEFADLLMEAVRESGMTVALLAKQVGVHPSMLFKIGRKRPLRPAESKKRTSRAKPVARLRAADVEVVPVPVWLVDALVKALRLRGAALAEFRLSGALVLAPHFYKLFSAWLRHHPESRRRKPSRPRGRG